MLKELFSPDYADPTSLLVYSDWLEENGQDEKAEAYRALVPHVTHVNLADKLRAIKSEWAVHSRAVAATKDEGNPYFTDGRLFCWMTEEEALWARTLSNEDNPLRWRLDFAKFKPGGKVAIVGPVDKEGGIIQVRAGRKLRWMKLADLGMLLFRYPADSLRIIWESGSDSVIGLTGGNEIFGGATTVRRKKSNG